MYLSGNNLKSEEPNFAFLYYNWVSQSRSRPDSRRNLVDERKSLACIQIQRHFLVLKDKIDLLLLNNVPFVHPVEKMEAIYYDFADFRLALSNSWLIKTNRCRWTLKTVKCAEKNFITYSKETDEAKIISKIPWEKSCSSLENNYELSVLAHLQFTRYYFPGVSDDRSLYIDVIKLKDNDFYAVACMSVTYEGDYSRSGYPCLFDVLQPVHSKIIEYIKHTNKSLFDQLLKKKVIPDCNYLASDLTHHSTDPVIARAAEQAVTFYPEQNRDKVKEWFSDYLAGYIDYVTREKVEMKAEDKVVEAEPEKKTKNFDWGAYGHEDIDPEST
eukprot:TRINITY_DN3564_c0_g2_i1.p1 TRINITY_DN3564_c0_g2~~TRINITY_DN3564_c0_g2_i1.p1  ORF type:complete len:328 (-),score=30.97 TRINITY_DN3564_c0_g2_i1:91-1074(-)